MLYKDGTLTKVFKDPANARMWIGRYVRAMPTSVRQELRQGVDRLRSMGYDDTFVVAALSTRLPNTWVRHGFTGLTSPAYLDKVARRIAAKTMYGQEGGSAGKELQALFDQGDDSDDM